MKRKPIDTINMDEFEVYRLVCCGDLSKFPNGFLDKNVSRTLVKHIIFNVCRFSREDICNKFNYAMLRDYNLGGVSKKFRTLYEGVDYIFNFDTYRKDPIMPWELNKVENCFWENIQNRIDFICWVAKKEGLDIFEIKDAMKITAVMVNKYGGSRPLKYAGGLHRLIMSVPGTKYKEWQFVKVNQWSEEKAIEAIKWLIEDVLCWSHEKIALDINAKLFYENNLGGLLSKVCFNSPASALELAYPGEYTSEELLKGLYSRRLRSRMKNKK